MSEMQPEGPIAGIDRSQLPFLILVILIACACLAILRPFLSPITWAAILAYVSWPAYKAVRRPFGRFKNATAFGMTVLLTCALIVPVLWLSVLISGELVYIYRLAAANLVEKPLVLPEFLRRIPWLAGQAQQLIDQLSSEPAALNKQITAWIQSWAGQITGLVGGVGRSVAELSVVMFTVFFFYRDGEFLLLQGRTLVRRVFGNRLDSYFDTAGAMTRAVLFGFLTTAFAQGLIAGIGYAVLGIHGSVLLGAMTGVLSVVPFLGTAIVWGSLSAYLLATGQILKGIMLLAWGTLLVHPTDNILRPLLISNATHVPFLIVMFGVIGGIAALGLVGIFVGPVVLAIGLAIWRNWTTIGDRSNHRNPG
jgi:predicted PurR-regulated permease PerM